MPKKTANAHDIVVLRNRACLSEALINDRKLILKVLSVIAYAGIAAQVSAFTDRQADLGRHAQGNRV
jgi:hypothetical protein